MTDQNDPKIIVDDDWKEQVAREKEELSDDESDSQTPPLPEASFGLLVTTLTTQALAAMGILPDPVSGNPQANLPMARHFVDTLNVLQEKTAGNLTEDESQLLNESLHQLRMAYVAAGQTDKTAANDSNDADSSPIELP